MTDKISYICDKIADAKESIEMLECVRQSMDRDLCTGNTTIIRDVSPESLDFVINHAINSIRRGLDERVRKKDPA